MIWREVSWSGIDVLNFCWRVLIALRPSVRLSRVRTIPQCSHIILRSVFRVCCALIWRVLDFVILKFGVEIILAVFAGLRLSATWFEKTKASSRELDARRFAPWTPVYAHSPNA